MKLIYKFITQFSVLDLSTGCKAALLVANNPDVEFDVTECGKSALNYIINYVKDGKIIIPEIINNFCSMHGEDNGWTVEEPDLYGSEISEIPGDKHYRYDYSIYDFMRSTSEPK